MEHWAEIRRLHFTGKMPIKAIASPEGALGEPPPDNRTPTPGGTSDHHSEALARRLLLACSACRLFGRGSTAGGDAVTKDAAAPSNSPSPRPACPNPEGQACLGPLVAGTYTTTNFAPAITYTVPDGWDNEEDNLGNFLLLPPGEDLPGVNAGTSDFIGVYVTVAAPDGCEPAAAPGVGTTAADLADWFAANPAMSVTGRKTVEVGGLRGSVMDLTLNPTWKGACPYSNGNPVAPMILAPVLLRSSTRRAGRGRSHGCTCWTTTGRRWRSR